MKHAYATTPMGQVHYAEEGGGEATPLVLLHASPRSSRVYAGLMPLLTEERRVFALDTLGSGGSAPLPPSVTMHDLARSVTGFLDAVGIERAHVFGVHTGNKIGAALAAGWPDRIAKLVLCGETHSIVVTKEARDAAIHAIVDRYFTGESASEAAGLLAEWAAGFTNLTGVWWNERVLAGRGLSAETLGVLEARAIDFLQARAGLGPLYEANFSFDFGEAVRRIPNPTLVIELAKADEAHLGRQGAAVVERLSDGTLATLEDTGAEVIEFEPRRIADVILPFLR